MSSIASAQSTGTPSPTKGSPTKSRSARLNERIERTRRHRQWVAKSNTSVASGSTASETASSHQDRARSKLAKVAEGHYDSYQRHKKATSPANIKPTSPTNQWNNQRGATGYQRTRDHESEGETASVEVTLSQAENYNDLPESSSLTSRFGKVGSPDDSARSAVVAWPDEEPEPEVHEHPSYMYDNESTPSAVKSADIQPKQSQTTQSAAPWSSNSLKKIASRDNVSRTSSFSLSAQRLAPEPVGLLPPDSRRKESATKRYAPREKGPEEPPKDHSTASKKWKKPDPVASSYASPATARSTSLSRTGKLAPWERPQVEYPDPEPDQDSEIGDRAGSIVSVASSAALEYPSSRDKPATWQKPQMEYPDPEPDQDSEIIERARSTVSVASSAALGYQSSRGKPAPWQKPQQAEYDYPDPEPDFDSEVGSRANSTVSVARSSASWQLRSSGKLAPWQKPRQQEHTDELTIQPSASWQNSQEGAQQNHRASTPTYEIGRVWQKPRLGQQMQSKSPALPPKDSGCETPSQMWRRKEQEAKVVSSENTPDPGKKLAPWQRQTRNRKMVPDRAPSTPTPSKIEPQRQSKVATPSWEKPSASPSPTAMRQPQQSKEPSWKRTVALSRAALESPITPTPAKDAYSTQRSTPQEHFLSTPVPFDATNEQGSDFTPSIGGAIIETPKSQSVASLRASLGSKPAPPPLPGFIPARADKSPGDSPWLAGNRKTANRGNRVGSPYLGGNNSEGPPSTPTLHDKKDPPVQSRGVAIERQKAQTPTRLTPVTSHVSNEARAARRAMANPSPIKSLAEMAADSAMMTNYSELVKSKSEEYPDDDESMLSSGIATNTPSRADLPAEFRDILHASSYDGIVQQRSQESHLSILVNDRSPDSLALTVEDVDRRQHLRDRVENYSGDEEEDDKEVVAPVYTSPPRPSKSWIPACPHPSQASAEQLNRIRSMGAEVEGSDAGTSSSAVFGDPVTWSAAGEEVPEVARNVSDRARAIADWNGGVRGADELDTVLGTSPHTSPRKAIDSKSSRSVGSSPPSAGGPAPGIRARAESIERRSHIHTSPSDERGGYSSPTRAAPGASRILKFFQNQDGGDELTGEEESEWASRDPDIQVMRDESPSPEAYTEEEEPEPDVELADYPSPPRPPRHPSKNHRVHFEPDSQDSFYAAAEAAAPTTSEKPNTALEQKLNPDDFFGTFWSTGNIADETFEFDEADASFFSSTSVDEKGRNESPFRVVLKPPRASPATRERRQREASHSFDSHYARYSSGTPSDDDDEFYSDPKLEI